MSSPQPDRYAQPAAMPSDYFAFREDLVLGESEIVVVSACRNELERLPYFLDYYRRLGVTRFLIVDNDSEDGTADFLRAQPDVEYFFTDTSYRGAISGRLWTQELADTYAEDRWVLTADADELLVYPGIESTDLPALCAYLDENKMQGLFTVLLDMYSQGALSDAVYVSGSDFLDTCPWFEIDSYHLSPGHYPPFLKLEGGPRAVLYEPGAGAKGPEATKVPLVKWHRGFSYVASTHSHRNLALADVTGALLHFKFFSIFKSVAERDSARGDQISAGLYDAYSKAYGDGDPVFWRPESIKYEDPAQMVRLGVIRSTPLYVEHLRSLTPEGEEFTPGSESVTPDPFPAGDHLDLRSLAQVWDLFNNPLMAAYYAADERTTPPARRSFAVRISRQILVIDIKPDHLLLEIRHTGLHIGRNSGLDLALYADDRLIATTPFDGTHPGLRAETTTLHPNTYRWDLDVASLTNGQDAEISLYLRDITAPDRGDGEILESDVQIYGRPWSARGVELDPLRYRGEIEAIVDGKLIGWVYDAEVGTFAVRVEVRVNGRLVAFQLPHVPRPELRGQAGGRGRVRPVGFEVMLPLGFFETAGPADAEVEVTVAGSNSALSHSPILVPAGHRSVWWDDTAGAWGTTPPPAPVEAPRRSFGERLRNRMRKG